MQSTCKSGFQDPHTLNPTKWDISISITEFIKNVTMNKSQWKHERNLDTKLELEDRSEEISQDEAQNQGDRKI